MTIEERVRALLESLRAGHACVEVDDVAGNDPAVISASVEMPDFTVWRVLDRAPHNEAAVQIVADVVRKEALAAAERYRTALMVAAREKDDAERMTAACDKVAGSAAEDGAAASHKDGRRTMPDAPGLWWVFMRGAEARLCHVRRGIDNRMRAYPLGWDWPLGGYVWLENGVDDGFEWVKCVAPSVRTP